MYIYIFPGIYIYQDMCIYISVYQYDNVSQNVDVSIDVNVSVYAILFMLSVFPLCYIFRFPWNPPRPPPMVYKLMVQIWLNDHTSHACKHNSATPSMACLQTYGEKFGSMTTRSNHQTSWSQTQHCNPFNGMLTCHPSRYLGSPVQACCTSSADKLVTTWTFDIPDKHLVQTHGPPCNDHTTCS